MRKHRYHILSLTLIVTVLLVFGQAAAQQQPAAPQATITVNAATDQHDPYTADGLCDICNNPDASPPVGPCGVCTLKAAIQTLNAGSGSGVIAFANTPLTIQSTGLPEVTKPVTIDGSGQVTVTGSNLVLRGGGSMVQQMIFQGNGIVLAEQGGNTLQNNAVRGACRGIYVYAEADDNTIRANTVISSTCGGSYGTGFSVQSHNNQILDNTARDNNGQGMWVTGDNNRIANNTIFNNHNEYGYGGGIWLGGSSNTVQNNRIGTDGNQALGNSRGIYVQGDSHLIGSESVVQLGASCTGDCNLIAGNSGHGIEFDLGSTDVVVRGNFIGANTAGTAPLPNGLSGIFMRDSSAGPGGNQIVGNLISGNGAPDLPVGFGNGIELEIAPNAVVQGNLIGVAIDGVTPLPNQGSGIVLDRARGVIIGGGQSGAASAGSVGSIPATCQNGCNVISANRRDGIGGGIGWENTIQGNFIGVTVNGAAGVGNGSDGIELSSFYTTTIQANAIAGNGGAGVTLSGGADGNLLYGNYIGVAPAGPSVAGNGGGGVIIQNSSYNRVGSALAGQGNVIAGHTEQPGVWIRRDYQALETVENWVQGNFIGTDPTGLNTDRADLPGVDRGWGNHWGVLVSGYYPGVTLIGGEGIAGNTISGNGIGVALGWDLKDGRVVGNRIGPGADGAPLTGGLSNEQGLLLGYSHEARQIGGTGGLSNLIAYNQGQGVVLDSFSDIETTAARAELAPLSVDNGRGTDLRDNRIFGNSATAIDWAGWAGDFRSPDRFDIEDLSLEMPNYPFLTLRPGNVVTGHFRGVAQAAYRLDLHAYTICNRQIFPGFGEGENWLASQDVTTDVRGNGIFTVTLPAALPAGYAVAGTLTDPDGSTSEFSNAPYQLSVVGWQGRAALVSATLDPMQATALAVCMAQPIARLVANSALSNVLSMTPVGDHAFTFVYTPTYAVTETLDLYLDKPDDPTFSFVNRLWLAPGPQVAFYQSDVPEVDTLIAVDNRGVVDGNQVVVEIVATNPYHEDVIGEVMLIDTATGQPLPGKFIFPNEETWHTFPAGQSATVKFLWDTTGFSWSDQQQPVQERRVQVVIAQPETNNVVIRSRVATIKIRPRPVVLVHGLWSNAGAWTNYQSFLNSVRPDWRAWAVGDGFAPGQLRTGVLTSPKTPSNTIGQNAKELLTYIEGVRELENAWHVDIVAHSMGGLISRHYLSNLAGDSARVPTDGYPVVNHLAMLGTPNMGSPCAEMVYGLVDKLKFFGSFGAIPIAVNPKEPWDPVMKDLMPSRVRDFKWRQPAAIPYSIYGGNPMAITCHDLNNPGDSVVPLLSALGLGSSKSEDKLHLARIDVSNILHTDMTDYLIDFQQYVFPILTGGPARAHERTLPKGTLGRAFVQDEEPPYDLSGPQMIWGELREVAAGATETVTFTVPASEFLAVTVVAPDTVTAQLRNPAAALTGDFGKDWFPTLAVEYPVSGVWSVALTNQDTVSATVTVAAAISGSQEALTVTIGEPSWGGMVPVTAQMQTSERASPQSSAVQTMTVRLTRSGEDGAEAIFFDLWDDGAHNDGGAGDGLFGVMIGPLFPDNYGVYVYAVGQDFFRGTVLGVDVPFARITKQVLPEGTVAVGDRFIYTVTVEGPAGLAAGVFDPLDDVTFMRFLQQPAGISYTNGAVTGIVTLPPPEQVVLVYEVEVSYVEEGYSNGLWVASHACVYPGNGDLTDCVWSRASSMQQPTPASRGIYLPFVMR